MRAGYIFVLIVGLACSETLAQGTASFGAPQKAAIEQLFDRYAAAFLNKDYVNLRESLQVPFIRFGPSNTGIQAATTDWVVSATMDENIDLFRASRDALTKQGVERFEWGQTRIIALSADRALVNKSYRRYRKDGILQETASVYVVSRSSGAWKICGTMNQDLREFGKVY